MSGVAGVPPALFSEYPSQTAQGPGAHRTESTGCRLSSARGSSLKSLFCQELLSEREWCIVSAKV